MNEEVQNPHSSSEGGLTCNRSLLRLSCEDRPLWYSKLALCSLFCYPSLRISVLLDRSIQTQAQSKHNYYFISIVELRVPSFKQNIIRLRITTAYKR